MIAIVTGSQGLIGSEAARFWVGRGFTVAGIDNDMRAYFFGPEASTAQRGAALRRELGRCYHSYDADVRDRAAIERIIRRYGAAIAVVVHAAAQPSHDWAAREPLTDFTVNALGTLHLLEATRQFAPEAVFLFTSTNKVYGDTPNRLPLVELAERWEVEPSHPYAARGIDESMSIDQSQHSVFGAGKVAADVMVQEYGRCYGMRTGVFRGGCLTGPAHAGAELHGFLSYLVRCAVSGRPYTIHGHRGKQVRDNIHSRDLVEALWQFSQAPRAGEVYNVGGSRHASLSILEAIRLLRERWDLELRCSVSPVARAGDHVWYVSDVSKLQRHYPAWRYSYDLLSILDEMVSAAREAVPARSRHG